MTTTQNAAVPAEPVARRISRSAANLDLPGNCVGHR